MPKFGSVRRSKSKFEGNQHTKCKKRKTDVGSSMTTNPVEPMEHKSVSFKKVGPTNTVEDETTNQLSIAGYRLVDMELLGEVFSTLKWDECDDFTLNFMENHVMELGRGEGFRV